MGDNDTTTELRDDHLDEVQGGAVRVTATSGDGVYVQEHPSGVKDRRAGHGIVLVGWDDDSTDSFASSASGSPNI